jgi:hypothetical protein
MSSGVTRTAHARSFRARLASAAMDSRDTRRAAEKAARALLQARAAAVGDLAVADTSRAAAGERLTAAVGDGQALIEAAQQQAAQLLTDARAGLDDAHSSYAAAHAAALDAGWQPAELATLGYPAPAGRRPRRRPTFQPGITAPPDVPVPHPRPDHQHVALEPSSTTPHQPGRQQN